MKKLIPTILAGVLLAGLTGSAIAGTATASFTTGVNVAQACEVSGTPADFGDIGILADVGNGITGADNLQTQSTLTLNCTDTVPITVSVAGVAQHSGGLAVGTYGMVDGSGGNLLKYRITQDSARQTPWGAVGQNAALAMTATVGSQTVPMYFSILGADNAGGVGAAAPVLAGSYSDTATVTVAW